MGDGERLSESFARLGVANNTAATELSRVKEGMDRVLRFWVDRWVKN